MSGFTEREKVRLIVERLENEIDGDLFLHDRKIGSVRTTRRGFGTELGSPDAVIWFEINVHVLGVSVALKMPVLVEAEDAGLSAAKDDVRKFFERDFLEIPMVVIGKRGDKRKDSTTEATVKVVVPMHLVGFDRVVDQE